MEALDRIKKAKISIMRHKQFCAYSGILACGDWVIDDSIPTACTNGWGARFNSKFVQSLNDPELRLLLLHEATHSAYTHLRTWRSLYDESPMLANIACDHFVNLSLIDTDDGKGFLAMPKAGVQPEPKYRGWSVKQIYDDLKNNPPQQKQSGKGQPQGGEGDDPGDDDGNDGNDGNGMDSHDWKGAGSTPTQEQAKQAEEIQRALRQGEIMRKKLAGKGAGNTDGMFGELLTPKVDWRKALRDFITETCAGKDESTWRKPNRRYLADDIYMPSMEGTTLGELLIGFDTSGSCFGGDEMTRFVTEITAIVEQLKPAKVHVAYVDTQVAGLQTFEGQFAVQNLKPKGGGGTHLPVLFDYCDEQGIKPQACVFFTDLYTDFGTAPSFPILWASTSSHLRAPYGVTISID